MPATPTRPNPDRTALMRDIVRTLAPTATELWRELWEEAREAAVTDLQAELIEGLRDFAQQVNDAMVATLPRGSGLERLTSDEQAAVHAWLLTAPATFRVGGPLERKDAAAAAAEADRHYAQLVVAFGGRPATQVLLGSSPKWLAIANALFRRALTWTAERLDRGIEEIAKVLWQFPPFQAALSKRVRARGADALHDELLVRVLEPFTMAAGAGAAGAAEELLT